MQDFLQNISFIKRKILLYLEFKGVTQYKFYKDTGITRGILNQQNGISEDNLLRFLAYAKDLNLDWFFRDIGSPTVGGNEYGMQKPLHRTAAQEQKPVYTSLEKEVADLRKECNDKGNKIISLLEELYRK